MTNRDLAKTQIDMLTEYNETDYLMSVPGMADVIKSGLNTPAADCAPLSEVWPDV